MILILENLLTGAEVESLRETLAKANFVDGRVTAGDAVRNVKNNLQVTAQQGPGLEEGQKLVQGALMKSEAFTHGVLPRRILPSMFNRYDAGMSYGGHVDNAIMGGGDAMRADISVTIFLTAPADYDGGELVIASDGESRRVKLPAGSGVAYNSTTIHRVEPVTRGSRLAAVTWVQSFVREESRREILSELAETARWARATAPGSPEAMKIAKVRANLMRMWAEV